jgi:tetrahydromethanopterin S-methyltransferase subunit H
MNIPLFGGDFALFGPIHHSSIIFPMIAWQDILVSEYTENYFGIEPMENHPRKRFYQ